MSTNWIVRHGATRFLGEFDPEGGTYARGDEIVIRTERGHELGAVLCPASAQAIALLEEPTTGKIARRMTDADRITRPATTGRVTTMCESCLSFNQTGASGS